MRTAAYAAAITSRKDGRFVPLASIKPNRNLGNKYANAGVEYL